eukprot:TRINITY_DN6158_c0_g1_i4.p1 TRINITY_DN6158_c0_g1~~TRINITY_DN6158_c0_g1_i4.p1  ORF type:complete len:228 (-),score=47.67 TRINITY_DN6158_c0_g1_i4:136-819(-)
MCIRDRSTWDRPVFPEDKRFADAYFRGGIEEEREERRRFKQEQEDEHLRNHYAFRDMIDRFRREGQARQEGEGQQQQEEVNNNDVSHSSRNDQSLPTYYSENTQSDNEQSSRVNKNESLNQSSDHYSESDKERQKDISEDKLDIDASASSISRDSSVKSLNINRNIINNDNPNNNNILQSVEDSLNLSQDLDKSKAKLEELQISNDQNTQEEQQQVEELTSHYDELD